MSCTTEDGTGGSGCAFRYFYNNGLISSCIWSYDPENYFYYKEATIKDTNNKLFTKLKHVNVSNSKWLEGCFGYYCTKIVIYDIIKDESETYWRRDSSEAPEDIDEGEECPGH
jgi:hypothetical protein